MISHRRRFLQSVPPRIGGGTNGYAYGEGNPLMEVDVEGLGCGGGKKGRKKKNKTKPNRENTQSKSRTKKLKPKKGQTVTKRNNSMRNLNDQELTRLSKLGNQEATYEKNRRKVEAATQSGDPKNLKNAHGAAIENKIADELGEDVVKAGEEVKYSNPSNPNRTLKSEIDLETKTKVIQIKSGQDLPDPRQTATTQSHAQQTGKTPVVYYNANEVPKRAVEQYKKNYPDIRLVPRNDFSFITP